MNILKYFMLDEVNIAYGKRELSYFDTGWSYWYNGREVSQGKYSDKKWKKIKDRFNNSFSCKIEINEEYNDEVATNLSNLIFKAVIEDKNNNASN